MKYDVYRIYTTQEAERTSELDYPIGEQIPYCKYWEAVRKVTNGNEPTFVLGHQPWTLQDSVGESCIQSDIESSEGTDASDWWEWYS